MNQKAYGSQEYRQQEVMGASPIRLVVMAYDLAILSCEKKDFGRATKAISLLRDALNFDTGETAVGLFRLYQWSLDCIRQGDYDSALQTLHELRESWATIEKRLCPIQAQATHPAAGNGVNYPAYRAATR